MNAIVVPSEQIDRASTDIAMERLLCRVSVQPKDLGEPGPTNPELEQMVDLAQRAPDHGALQPANFLIIRGEQRRSFGELLAVAAIEKEPDTPPSMLERYRTLPQQVPVVVVIGARIKTQHRVPVSEQLLSVGAAGMNFLNAAHLMGFGAIWLTGTRLYDAKVGSALGFTAPDRPCGLIFIGTPRSTPRHKRRPRAAARIEYWTPCP